MPITLEISPDLRVLAFAVAAALAAGLVFGLAPALQGARRDITDRLKAESAGTGRRRSRLGRVLVAGQLALSLVLLVAAGLFVRAVDRGARIDPGFDRDGIATTLFDPESWGYDTGASTAFYAAVRERLATTPGVSAVAYTSRLPLMLGSSIDTIAFGTSKREAHYAGVDEGYFDVLRLPILRGRAIARTDVAGAVRVAIVNQTLARILAPDGDALGRTFRFRDAETIVVGVARDAKYASLDETTPPFFYVPLAQLADPKRALLVRGPAATAGPAIVEAVRAADPRLPAPRVAAFADEAQVVLFPQRAAAIVTGGARRDRPAAGDARPLRHGRRIGGARGRARSASGWRSAPGAARCCGPWSAKVRGWRSPASPSGCRWRRCRCRCCGSGCSRSIRSTRRPTRCSRWCWERWRWRRATCRRGGRRPPIRCGRYGPTEIAGAAARAERGRPGGRLATAAGGFGLPGVRLELERDARLAGVEDHRGLARLALVAPRGNHHPLAGADGFVLAAIAADVGPLEHLDRLGRAVEARERFDHGGVGARRRVVRGEADLHLDEAVGRAEQGVDDGGRAERFAGELEVVTVAGHHAKAGGGRRFEHLGAAGAPGDAGEGRRVGGPGRGRGHEHAEERGADWTEHAADSARRTPGVRRRARAKNVNEIGRRHLDRGEKSAAAATSFGGPHTLLRGRPSNLRDGVLAARRQPGSGAPASVSPRHGLGTDVTSSPIVTLLPTPSS